MTMQSEKIKDVFVVNWISKLVSLLIAVVVWFTIFSHLDRKNQKTPPIPGTEIRPTAPPSDQPTNPLITPVPGA